MKNNMGTFFQRCLLIFACGLLAMALFTSSGCGRKEAEFLEAVEQPEKKAGNEGHDPSEEEDARSAGQPEEASPEGKQPSEENRGEWQSEDDSGQQGISRAESILPAEIYVDVCGAVAEPGVYRLDADSRVFHAIKAAGGFLPEAAGEYINQAEKVEDGQQIYIPTREEVKNRPSYQNPLEKSLSDEEAKKQGSEAGTSGKVNLNTADEDALTTLTGIGASKAQAILAYREEHGGFSAIEEILNVPGIKEGTFVKIKDNIAVE